MRRPKATQQAATSAGTDWPSFNGSLDGTRYSPLTQITPANASNLERACTFDTGENMSMQSGPVVVGYALYLTTDNFSRLRYCPPRNGIT